MYPRTFAQQTPEKPAVIFEPSGRTISYLDLERLANKAAHLFRGLGIEAGGKVAFALENCPEIYALVWGAQRAGLFYVPISSRLKADEIGYIVRDSGATLLLSSDEVIDNAGNLPGATGEAQLYTIGRERPGWENWAAALAVQPATPIADERPGIDMLYSSGTTGHPKGIVRQLPPDEALDEPNQLAAIVDLLMGSTGAETVYLSPAPLYHAAPLGATTSIHRLGGTVVVLEKFDPELVLSAIDRHKVTSGQFVPTHFIRMLRLPEEVRARYSHATLVRVVHAAAPCPIPVKQAMIDWWGAIVTEYYGGSEGGGIAMITAPEWLERQGSVGRAVGCIFHVCNEEGNDVPPRVEGQIYLETGQAFHYHNDPAKTAEAVNAKGWLTLGDIGWLDEDGFLYLTDRKSFMIISGGVNIYPQEIENLLATHPKIADVAIIGAPDPEMGEKVVAVVQAMVPAEAGDALAAEIIAYCRANLSGVKVPRQVDFTLELPRMPTGKLFKRLLRDAYWKAAESGEGAPAEARVA